MPERLTVLLIEDDPGVLRWTERLFADSGCHVVAAVSAIALGAPAQAATTLSAGWNEGCGKSTCFNEKGVFQQSFSAKDFGGPVTIGQLLLERGVLGALDGSTFQLSFALNGETLGTWGQYTMAGIGGDWLTFGGEGFTWNPDDGDLVLILALVPPPKPGAGRGFFASSSFQSDETSNSVEQFDGPGLDKDFFPDGNHTGLVVVKIGKPGPSAFLFWPERRRFLLARIC